MVGVPHSRGCRNCRRMKKGCDLQRPTCGQCSRLGINCEWASKQYTFVLHNRYQRTNHVDTRKRGNSTPDLRRKRSATPTIGGLQELSLEQTNQQQEMLSTFWDCFLPNERVEPVDGLMAGSWVRTIWTLSELDSTVKLCLAACASMAIGRLQSNPSLVQEGIRSYGRALRETNLALQHPVRAQSDVTLASVKLLSLYEFVRLDRTPGVTSQGHDWHKHIEGTCRIVELRGPEKHVTLHGHALFENARTGAIISGITLRRANFFTGPAWHTIPWETHPRNLRDELHDIMIALPDMEHKHDILQSRLRNLNTNQALFNILTQTQTHLNRCIAIATSLREWERRALAACLRRSNPHIIEFIGPLSLVELCKDYGYGFFHTVMMYFTACTILYGSAWIIKRNVTRAVIAAQQLMALDVSIPTQSEPASNNNNNNTIPTLMQLPEIPLWMNPHPTAAGVAKRASHYFEEDAGFWGSFSGSFPIGAAIAFYGATGGQDSEEMALLNRFFKKNKFGATTSDFLRSMANTGETTKGGDPRDREEKVAMMSSWYGTGGKGSSGT